MARACALLMVVKSHCRRAQISQLPSELFRRLSLGRIDPAPFIEEAPPQRRGWHV